MRPPKTISPLVRAFAREVVGGSPVDLSFVKCSPLEGIPDLECFPNVEEYTKSHGGAGVLGWAIWERPKLFIEAEFHMVWESPEQKLKDIARRSRSFPRILFLRDPERSYDGRQVDNVRKPLTKDKNVKRYLELFAEKHRLLNEGDLADYHGPVVATPEMLAVQDEIERLEVKISERYGAPRF